MRPHRKAELILRQTGGDGESVRVGGLPGIGAREVRRDGVVDQGFHAPAGQVLPEHVPSGMEDGEDVPDRLRARKDGNG